ncbi:MAG: hypothetical protein DRN14_02725 [Thermoplasmata archaeon]|nr:MAG: hypothetical protein DRN14_02725 [Thermoplasmata archaeon]
MGAKIFLSLSTITWFYQMAGNSAFQRLHHLKNFFLFGRIRIIICLFTRQELMKKPCMFQVNLAGVCSAIAPNVLIREFLLLALRICGHYLGMGLMSLMKTVMWR